MKANELRIGNYVYDRGGKLLQIDWFEKNKVCMRMWTESKIMELHPMTEEFEYCQPIPLTEIWFNKFGIRGVGLSGNMFIYKDAFDNGSRFIIEWDGESFYPEIDFAQCSWAELKYVHQLQNLYFALMGEELKIDKS